MRLDKWLWAARFYKTRRMATDAVSGGKVKLNGATVKPAKEIKLGDRLDLRTGADAWEVVVAGLNEQRRPAAEARLLFSETPESMKRRARAAELRSLEPAPVPEHKGRPTKRDRRHLSRFQQG